jgi:hypothetical protein
MIESGLAPASRLSGFELVPLGSQPCGCGDPGTSL